MNSKPNTLTDFFDSKRVVNILTRTDSIVLLILLIFYQGGLRIIQYAVIDHSNSW